MYYDILPLVLQCIITNNNYSMLLLMLQCAVTNEDDNPSSDNWLSSTKFPMPQL
jgi:hypothetical protein